jgi:hypothetical protein
VVVIEEGSFVVDSRPPLFYLDHWALRRIAASGELMHRFRDVVARRGTLLFSLMNVVEIARDGEPTRAAQIRELLDAVGVHWAPMSIDALAIASAEEAGQVADIHPCVSSAFLLEPAFASQLLNGPVSLTHVVDLTRGADGAALRDDTDAACDGICADLGLHRERQATDPSWAHTRYPHIPFRASAPTRGIYNGLVRTMIRSSFRLNRNHVRDLFHAVGAVRCADLVTLDAHWAESVRQLGLPTEFGRVYSEPQLEQFLSDIDSWPVS